MKSMINDWIKNPDDYELGIMFLFLVYEDSTGFEHLKGNPTPSKTKEIQRLLKSKLHTISLNHVFDTERFIMLLNNYNKAMSKRVMRKAQISKGKNENKPIALDDIIGVIDLSEPFNFEYLQLDNDNPANSKKVFIDSAIVNPEDVPSWTITDTGKVEINKGGQNKMSSLEDSLNLFVSNEMVNPNLKITMRSVLKKDLEILHHREIKILKGGDLTGQIININLATITKFCGYDVVLKNPL